ncbi:MAG: hypothetical protein ABIS06_17155 [Vicinamibacterales bacterium]
MNRARRTAVLAAVCLLAGFVLLATFNSGGYRYGASDQAFYQPSVLARLDPALFPRDGSLIAAQATLTLADESVAAVARVTGLPLPDLFLALYLLTLLLFAAGAWSIATRIYVNSWTCVALLAALTLRHAIARSGTNTLEGYFHPRQLAFAFGVLAVASFLRDRRISTALLVVAAAAFHPTTALWFAVWLGVATFVVHRSTRLVLGGLAAVTLVTPLWALTVGPLAGRLQPMDPDWLATLTTKDYLFPMAWPAFAWIFNLGTVALLAGAFVIRRRAGLVADRERALAAGCFSLAVIFFTALVLQYFNVALAIQLQPARTFWMFDFLGTVYIVWLLAEAGAARQRRAVVLCLVVLAFSVTRGSYVLTELNRRPFRVDLADDDWGRVMRWARTTDKGSGWLADPMHAVLYGTSLRVAGERDVFVEGVKDAAIGIYDRAVAIRTAARMRELSNFQRLTADDARSLASRYNLDFLVTPAVVDLPVAFVSGELRVYRLR